MSTAETAPRESSAGLPFYARYTFALQLRAEILNNLFAGVIGLHDAVARKGLGAGEGAITLLATAGSASQLFALIWSYAMEGRSKKPFILASALVGRGSLLLMYWAISPAVFIALCCFYFLSEPLFIPAQNALLQANYGVGIRGHVFGTVTALGKIAFLVSAVSAGWLLDAHAEAYRWAFPAAGFLGLLAYLQYAWIRIRRWKAAPREIEPGFGGIVRNFLKIMREDRNFNRFERNFMIYGMAFMIVLPVNTFLLVDELRLDYSRIALARLVVVQLIGAATSTWFGKLLDRIGAPKVSALSFAILVLYAGFLGLAALFHSIAFAFAGFAAFGVAMSGVNAAWSLGAMKYAGNRDAAAYMGVHVACVGFRGLFGPTIGTVIALALGLHATYAVSVVLFATASLLMIRLSRD